MQLNLDGKYHSVYKKYSKQIITYFCNGIRPKEITEKLHDEFGVKISYQAINLFYCNNKEYIDSCIQSKKSDDLEKVKEAVAYEYCTSKLKEFLYLLSEDLSDIVEHLEPKEKGKLIVSISNAIAKFEGMDRTEVNMINNSNASSHEIDDTVLEELLDVIETTSD